jgi:hypothetical protein
VRGGCLYLIDETVRYLSKNFYLEPKLRDRKISLLLFDFFRVFRGHLFFHEMHETRKKEEIKSKAPLTLNPG